MELRKKSKSKTREKTRHLRIGDQWNAITIIALSQNNPLKAIAEFVENSIDAQSKNILIIRGKAKGKNYLKISDDGSGVPLEEKGVPNFPYVATHICDSIKKKLKAEGAVGLQGEFGIGLLSFWTVGETMTLACCGTDGAAYQMKMKRGEPGYAIARRHLLVPFKGTEMIITPLLAGLRQINGEKIQRYLASELRDRIHNSQAKIKVIDHFLRAEYSVEPREFSGQLIHQIPVLSTPEGEIYTELYLGSPGEDNKIGLYRAGTRVLFSLTQLDEFNMFPWTSGYLQGVIDAPFLNLTPGTRDGLIRDERFDRFCQALGPLRDKLREVIEEQERAREERSSKQILKAVQEALKEAILSLPQEEYDWFEVHPPRMSPSTENVPPGSAGGDQAGRDDEMIIPSESSLSEKLKEQKSFFEFAGPLHSVKVLPASCNMAVNNKRNFRAACRDKQNRQVDQRLLFKWTLLQGNGTLENADSSIVTFMAPAEPGLIRLGVTAIQDSIECPAEAVITVTDSIIPDQLISSSSSKKGLPGYTLRSAPGEMWRSKYDADQNLVTINNAHKDFVFASRERSRKLRYICRLFIKELVLANFLTVDPAQLLERMIELSLYTEEGLR